ncbi:2-oxo acid dehydrogenase subunit E2 [Streptomyces sp. NPDC055794]
MSPDSTSGVQPRVAENLNRALHRLFDRDPQLYLLGEDVLDPYGGAFKITKGLSSKHGERLLTTPISEGGILGVGGGLALCGNKVIVEIMFGDFLALGFDQVLNFASKSVSMYGRHVPVPLVVRCPVGGNRGYGPTHSQSPQKHFVGVPNLTLYELSPFHDAEAILEDAFRQGTPAVLFEDKVLYTRRMYGAGRVDEVFDHRRVGTGPVDWAHAYPRGRQDEADFVVIAPGGVAHRALDAARELHETHGRAVHVVVPARLHPLDIEPVRDLLAAAGGIAVVEEGTAGGTWGADVARRLYDTLWPSLRSPVLTLSSADSIIPTAAHLERDVLLGAADIRDAIRQASRWDDSAPRGPAAPVQAPATTAAGTPVAVPKLNNNDATYLLADWLVDDGAWVEEGTEIAVLDTSKTAADIEATASGHLRHVAAVGDELAVGAVLGRLLPEGADLTAPLASRERSAPARVRTAATTPAPRTGGRPEPHQDSPRTHTLDRAQRGTAAVVTQSHREIPAGFTVMKADVDTVLHRLETLGEASGATIGLAETVIKAVAEAHPDFPAFYGSLIDDRSVELAGAPHVGVTVDVDGALYVPVVRDANELSLEDIADTLMDFRMKAWGKEFAEHELSGGNIAVSLNPDPGVVHVHPIVMRPHLCMLSVGAVDDECRIDADGRVSAHRVVHLGLAYDHRVINGRDAVLFLSRIKSLLQEPEKLGGEDAWTTG